MYMQQSMYVSLKLVQCYTAYISRLHAFCLIPSPLDWHPQIINTSGSFIIRGYLILGNQSRSYDDYIIIMFALIISKSINFPFVTQETYCQNFFFEEDPIHLERGLLPALESRLSSCSRILWEMIITKYIYIYDVLKRRKARPSKNTYAFSFQMHSFRTMVEIRFKMLQIPKTLWGIRCKRTCMQ